MKKNEKDFLLFAMRIMKRKEWIKSIIFYTVFLFPSIFAGKISIIAILSCVGVLLLYAIGVHRLFDGNGIIKGHNIFLCYAIDAICLTCTFLIPGFRIQLLITPEKYKWLVIILILLGVIVLIGIYALIVKQLTQKGAYSKVKTVQRNISFAFFGVLGMVFARFFLNSVQLTGQAIIQIVVILLFVLSGLSLLGVINLYKYYAIKSNKELLKEIDIMLKKT